MSSKDMVISLYAHDSWKRWFAKWRFWVAPYVYVEKLVPKTGTVLELGCGEGFFSNYMAISSRRRKVIGVEIDKARVKIADKKIKNATFIEGDALSQKLGKLDCVVLFHVLHHLKDRKSQQTLVKKVAKTLKKNGKIIIVEIDKDFSLKYYITWFWDHFMVPWFFEKRFYQRDIYFRTQPDWIELFKACGLASTAKKYDRDMPFSHIVYACTSKK